MSQINGENSFEILVAKFNYFNADNMLSNLTGWDAESTKAVLSADFFQPTNSGSDTGGPKENASSEPPYY